MDFAQLFNTLETLFPSDFHPLLYTQRSTLDGST